MGAFGRLWFRLQLAIRRMRGPYARWSISRWDTPISHFDRILVVSLCDRDHRLVVDVEAPWEPSRPRWRVSFTNCQAYRNADELHLTALWGWLDSSGQRCGSTFVVENSSWIKELVELQPLRHYVVATLDDVIEVACETEPVWETLESAPAEPPLDARSRHLWIGEDDARIDDLKDKLRLVEPREDPG